MAQNWHSPNWTDGSTDAQTILKTELDQQFETVRTMFSGATAPTSTAPFQLWQDTTANWLKIRNSGDSSWVSFFPADTAITYDAPQSFGTVSASVTDWVIGAPWDATVSKIGVLVQTASTSSSGNEVQFDLFNVKAAVSLFSGTVGTFTALAGVGGGSDPVAGTVWWLTPDQNANISANDGLELRVTYVGAPGSLGRMAAIPVYYQRP